MRLIIPLIIFLTACVTSKSTNCESNVGELENQSHIIRGIDISKAPPNQQQIILYMETLTDEQAFEFLKMFVSGEIIYKKDSTITDSTGIVIKR